MIRSIFYCSLVLTAALLVRPALSAAPAGSHLAGLKKRLVSRQTAAASNSASDGYLDPERCVYQRHRV